MFHPLCKLWKMGQSLTKLNIYLPFDLAMSLLGVCLREMQMRVPEKTHTRVSTTALFTIVPHGEQRECPTKAETNKLGRPRPTAQLRSAPIDLSTPKTCIVIENSFYLDNNHANMQ